ncbi:tetrahydroberberine oxidase-like [Ziziphus jujuba]|uniref:Tetrahydroberberine oxidase-like n=1 Tax=Ziziphus jujuba TaxID=326968 RepID=A0ABM3IRU5_ZIZJJ|nr:tetrahydroberberine oxidase-like [Ziziphus jujuba]
MGKFLIFGIFFLFFSVSTARPHNENGHGNKFLSCFALNSPVPITNISSIIHNTSDPSYPSILQSSIQNLRFNSTTILKPCFIITPEHFSHVQAAVNCSKIHGLEVRVRSGGHDYEGLSYTARNPFVIIDLVNLRQVRIDLENGTAWVQTGATLGEVYYKIGNASNTYGFPAGTCPTLGVGGHISGGGQGFLMRKYGLAADNVLDAVIVNARGEILSRSSMGEDLFWAIRGGGAASFGVVVEWKIKLVPVPPRVTGFIVSKTLDQGATKLLHRWQQIADKFVEDLFIRPIIIVTKGGNNSTRNILVKFQSLFLGSLDQLLPLMERSFPELGLEAKDCREMRWVESILYIDDGFPSGESLEILLDRKHNMNKGFFKAKSDFVTKPISENDLENIWKVMEEGESGIMIWEAYGGKMGYISETETPFPHRGGVLFNIQYYNGWAQPGNDTETKRLDWINKVYDSMAPFVTKNPRTAYLNYRDLDLGRNKVGTFSEAKVWGEKYFKSNFYRLARVKGEVDPENFFKNEQSIIARRIPVNTKSN